MVMCAKGNVLKVRSLPSKEETVDLRRVRVTRAGRDCKSTGGAERVLSEGRITAMETRQETSQS